MPFLILLLISTKFSVHSSGRGHTHPDMSSLFTTNYTIDEVPTTDISGNIFSSMAGIELTSCDLIKICKILVDFYSINV